MSETIELKPKSASKQSDIRSDVESAKRIKSESDEKTGEKPDKSDKSKSENSDNSKHNLEFYEKRIRKLFIPVTLSMIIVLVSLTLLPYYAKPQSYDSGLNHNTEHAESLSTGVKLKEALIAAAVLLIIAVVVTFIMALLIIRKCYRVLNIIFTVVFTISLTTTFITFFGAVVNTYNIPFDIITAALILWNYVFVGITAIFFDGPKFVSRVYLVFVCALIALMLNKLLPSWTTWAILVMFSLWDIYAVFCGPLKLLSKNKKELIENVKLPIYTMIIFAETETAENEKKVDKKDAEKAAEDDGGGLGLGDFVFYGLLVAKTYTTASVLIAIMCLIAILFGLFLTLYCMVLRSRQAMPALPISIFLGLMFYFIGIYFIMPFNEALVSNQIFI